MPGLGPIGVDPIGTVPGVLQSTETKGRVVLVSSATCCCGGGGGGDCDDSTPDQSLCVVINDIKIVDTDTEVEIVDLATTSSQTAEWTYATAFLDPPYVTQLTSWSFSQGGDYEATVNVYIRCFAGVWIVQIDITQTNGSPDPAGFPITWTHTLGAATNLSDLYGSYDVLYLAASVYSLRVQFSLGTGPCES